MRISDWSSDVCSSDLDGFAISSTSCSGGEASVMADAAEGRRVTYRALTAGQARAVKATLGPLVTVANPLDYHTFIWANEPAMTATFAAMVAAGFDLNLLVLDFPRADRCSDADWWPTVRAFEAALKTNGARGAIVASLPENLSEGPAADLLARGIATRSEERRVGKACVSTGSSRWRPYHKKKKNQKWKNH